MKHFRAVTFCLMSDKPNLEADKKEEEKMDSVETKKEEKAIEEEIGYERLMIQNRMTTFINVNQSFNLETVGKLIFFVSKSCSFIIKHGV